MRTLHQIRNYANVVESISEVLELRRERQCYVVGLPYVFLNKVTMQATGRALKCHYKKSGQEEKKFNHNRLDLANDYGFQFVSGRNVYSVNKSDWFIKRVTSFGIFNEDEPWNLEWNIYGFHRGPFPEISDERERYFRYISPIAKKFDFFPDLEFCSKDIGLGTFTNEALIIRISGIEFSFYKVKKNEDTFLVVDNMMPISRKRFDKGVSAILFAVGFIKQNIHLDESYTFVIDHPQSGKVTSMQYMSLRESIRGQYEIFTTNAYSVRLPIGNLYGFDGIADINNWSNKLYPCPQKVVDKLANLIYQYPILANCIAILVDGSKAGLEIQGASFAVALEALTELIKEEKLAVLNKVKPVVDKSKWKKLRKDYLNLLEEAGLSVEEKEFITKKLNNLNQPTNIDKLQLPFAALGVTLSQAELDAIEMRNNFLHGRNDCDLNPTSINKMVWICKLLHQLCCILLFKLSGFSGYIIDQTAFDVTNGAVVNPATGFRMI